MTPEEFVAKIRWEGGVVGALEYGLTAEDLPKGSALREAWHELEVAWTAFHDYVEDVEEMLGDPE